MRLNRKYIITEVLKKGVMPRDYVIINGVPLDTSITFCLGLKNSLGEKGLEVGDIVDMGSDGIYHKKQHKDCESAIVVGRDEKTVYAFCAKYGDIIIDLLDKYSFNPIDTQRGDEILIQKTSGGKFEILTNKTIDKLRSDFLQRQK